MSEKVKSAMIASAIAMSVSLASVVASHRLVMQQQEQIDALSQAIFKTRIKITSPDERTGFHYILPKVAGVIEGDIPANTKVLVGHRALSEERGTLHADSYAEILADGTFVAKNIYLGSPQEEVADSYEIVAILAENAILGDSPSGLGENPLPSVPRHIARAVTIVERNR